MLELIVLGQIPGTHFQFSYAGIMLLTFALVIVFDLRRHIPRVQLKKPATTRKIAIAKV